MSPEVRLKVRDAFLADVGLIESFAAENPARLPEDDLAIVRSWRHLVAGKFYVFRELAKYTVLLSTERQPVAYGVLALSQPFEDLIGPYLPVLTQTVLLPFKGRIVYDGLMTSYRISFGPGIRRNLTEDFKGAKLRHGIVTSLPMSGEPVAPAAITPKATPRPKAQPPKTEAADVSKVIVGLTDQFCREHLTLQRWFRSHRRSAASYATWRPGRSAADGTRAPRSCAGSPRRRAAGGTDRRTSRLTPGSPASAAPAGFPPSAARCEPRRIQARSP
ncbi:hypothetical protein [Urbifossiella limnaea]|uniref:hypothetical protein n=1 Tax=Urbifossiella limnaea TaxID=2528023 RepID=UPI0011A11ACB|nr:hypothetical protein [Urbifossiella limnaea]